MSARNLIESVAAPADNPYNALCPVCSTPAKGCCRCMGPHTVEDLKKGHGLVCVNGHRWSGDVVLR